MDKRIIVGLSGGVDSAVTVHLLKEQGYDVVGVFLEMLEDSNNGELKRTKILANQLGIELIKKDIRRIFQKDIINGFINSYKNGLTPNPCVGCNLKIKFKYLLNVAGELGIENVATGHYARISDNSTGGKGLLKAQDESKDQSYFLYRLTQRELERVKFPLGELQKKEVKKIADKIGLKVPKVESQDVCFLKDFKSLEEFLQKKLNKGDFIKGDIVVDSQVGEKEVLGEHQGLLIYTIGQRKGLNVGGDGPFYVVGKDFENNELLVSRDKQAENLSRKEIIIDNINWINEEPIRNIGYQIKIRYQMKSVEAKLEKSHNGRWKVKCAVPVWAVAPGQSLVVYSGDRVVGGGAIIKS